MTAATERRAPWLVALMAMLIVVGVGLRWGLSAPAHDMLSAVASIAGSILGFLIGAKALLVALDGPFTRHLHVLNKFTPMMAHFAGAMLWCMFLMVFSVGLMFVPENHPVIWGPLVTVVWVGVVARTIAGTGLAALIFNAQVAGYGARRANELRSAPTPAPRSMPIAPPPGAPTRPDDESDDDLDASAQRPAPD